MRVPGALKQGSLFVTLWFMSSKQTLMKSADDFFHHLIGKGLCESGVDISPCAKNYLSELLQFYIFSDHLFSEVSSSGKKQIGSLAEMYLNSQASRKGSNDLKKIGDMSLYISGFFRESLKRRLVSLDYYIQMGKNAYENLACFRDRDLFEELAHHFKDLVFAFFCIYKKSTLAHHNYIISLVDQYMDTHSHKVAQKLGHYGIQLPFKKH